MATTLVALLQRALECTDTPAPAPATAAAAACGRGSGPAGRGSGKKGRGGGGPSKALEEKLFKTVQRLDKLASVNQVGTAERGSGGLWRMS